jgi:hypothetical protein
MSPEERELLEESVELSKENNEILRSMRRSQRIGNIMSFLYWVFIIGTAFGAYYFLQPYVDQIMEVYGGAKNAINQVKTIGS